jgi:ABC-type branched-subunit amino acid transport system substrate-binding protein
MMRAASVAGQLELVVGDTQANPTVGVNEARRLVERGGVKFVIGDTFSSVVLAAAPILNEAKVPSVNLGGSELLTPEKVPYSFSTYINVQSQAELMVKDARERLGAKSVAIISDVGAQAKTGVIAIKAELQKYGMTLSGEQEFQYESTDMTPQLLALKKGNPDALLLFASLGEDTGSVLKGMEELGWDLGVSGSYGAGLTGPGIAIAGKEAYAKLTSINYRAWSHCDGDKLTPKQTAFLDGLKAFRPEAYDRLPYNYVSIWYDSVFLMKAAIEANNGSTDADTFAKWVEAGSGTYDGINSTQVKPTPGTHFLTGTDILTNVFPADTADGGSQKRADCK